MGYCKSVVFSLFIGFAFAPSSCGDSDNETDTEAEVENNAALCSDGEDNDGDGAADCEDGNCSAFCVENSADLCDDGEDNDGDGAVDCEDDDCAAFCASPTEWRTTWVSAQQLTESDNMPPDPGLAGNTLRQVIQLTIGGDALRFGFSNEYGEVPLTIVAAAVAASEGKSTIDTETSTPLTFEGESSVTIPEGETVMSDPVEWEADPLADLAVTMLFDDAPPGHVTGHPGSRTKSFLSTGDTLDDETMMEKQPEHWYFLNQVDVLTYPESKAVVTFGDSITDGRGSATNMNNRWPNDLFRRLMDNAGTENIAVLNQGVGGNCVTRTCLGPSGTSRFARDVFEQPIGTKWLIILEGINDLNAGTSAETLIDSFTTMAETAHEQDIIVIGGTIMACEGHEYYSEELETNRQAVNEWIRTTDVFDAVIDFDEITRDPENPTSLSADMGAEDGLHPSVSGYQIMADAIDLALFELGADTDSDTAAGTDP